MRFIAGCSLDLQSERMKSSYVKDNSFFYKRKYGVLYDNSGFVFISFFLYRDVHG